MGSSNLRVSQLLAGLTCLCALGLMLFVLVFRRPEPEQLWLNRKKKAAEAPEEPAPEPEAAELMSEERFDEELSDAFRILAGSEGRGGEENNGKAVEEAAADAAADNPTQAAGAGDEAADTEPAAEEAESAEAEDSAHAEAKENGTPETLDEPSGEA